MTTAPAPLPRHLRQLDALRALAALGVLVTHVAYFSNWYGVYAIGPVVAHLAVAVPIFFGLSGFLLGGPFLNAIVDRRPLPSWRTYGVRRALRILPVFWITVVAAMLLVAENRDLPWWRWLTTATLTDIYVGTAAQGLGHIWSLSIEAQFYLVLPLLAILIRAAVRRPSTAAVQGALAGIAAFGIAWEALSTSLLAPLYDMTYWWPFPYLTWFAVGMLLATVAHAPSSSTFSRVVVQAAQERLTCWILAAAVFVVASTPLTGPITLDPSTAQQQTARLVLHATVTALVLMPLTLGPRSQAEGPVVGVLGAVGLISYGIFCVHQVLLVALADAFGWESFEAPGFLLLGATLGSTLVVAAVLYRWVERPSQALARRLTTGSSHPSATTTSS